MIIAFQLTRKHIKKEVLGLSLLSKEIPSRPPRCRKVNYTERESLSHVNSV